MSPEECLAGHVKRNPDTGDVALRTPFSTQDFPDNSWIVIGVRSGAKTRPHSHVEGWDDIYTQEAGS